MALSAQTIVKFSVTGLTVSYQFQQCQYIVNQLHKYYPDRYLEPQIRPMLNVDWAEYLLNVRRKYGKGLWKLKSPVAVFKNDEFLGDNQTLIDYISERYTINLKEDFVAMGEKQLLKYFEKMYTIGRDFAYILLSINGNVIGSLVIMTYSDLVPESAKGFLNRCRRNILAPANVRLVRVVPNSWLQFKALTPVGSTLLPCENYAIPHDRRGVVSLYQHDRKRLSATEFVITLGPTAWMDHHYFAFAQVIQGEETLRILEQVPVRNEIPTQVVNVVSSNKLTFTKQSFPETYIRKRTTSKLYLHEEISQDVKSILDERRFRDGLYCLPTDLRSYKPFLHLPDYLLAYMKNNMIQEAEEAEEQEQVDTVESCSPEEPQSRRTTLMADLDMKNVKLSRGFNVRSKDHIIKRMSLLDLPQPQQETTTESV